ncbi:uncharacterized protein LOC141903689 [Tubulanus polymorphus]|uniref:uncharacterized protein LOC141903689 n=1 Tax=Tubulanus polymorphus TaxID=672921 RepID=UPI003DA66BF9
MVLTNDKTKTGHHHHRDVQNSDVFPLTAQEPATVPRIPAHGSQSVFQRTRPNTSFPSRKLKNVGQGRGTIGILSNLGDTFITATKPDGHRRPVTCPSTWRTMAGSRLNDVRPIGKGARPMHLVTHLINEPSEPDYISSTKQAFSGRKDLKATEKPNLCRSMHSSQIRFSNDNSTWQEGSKYYNDYQRKQSMPANQLHESSLVNRINMVEGDGFRNAVNYQTWKPNYWTEYSRIHNTLGFMRGTGAPRPLAERRHYNIINGQETPYMKMGNHRLQGLVIT